MSKPSQQIYSVETSLSIPRLNRLAEDVLRQQQNPQQGYRSIKYLKAQKSLTVLWVLELVEAHPDWLLKDVLMEIIRNSPDDLPVGVLSERIQCVLTEWKKMGSREERTI